jgi:hypothetical protein
MLQAKLMWRHVHSLQQFPAFIDDGGSIAPGEHGCEKSGYFNVLLSGELVRDTDGVACNKARLIIPA